MNLIKTVILLSFLSALLVLVGYLLVGGTMGAAIGLGFAVFFNFSAWFYSDRIALAYYRARPPSPSQAALLEPMTRQLCDRAQLPIPKIYVVPTAAANAFATGRSPDHAAVAVTEGLMDLLNDAELEAVIAHELSHIKNWDTLTQTVAATIAGAISMLAEVTMRGFWFFGSSRPVKSNPLGPVGSLLMLLMAPVTATTIQMTISRTREFAADAGAALLTANPLALASALEKLDNKSRKTPMKGNPAFAPMLIVNAFDREFAMRLFSTHPPIAARIQQLQNLQMGLRNSKKSMSKAKRRNQTFTSVAIILAALGLTYAPIPGWQTTVTVVSGTELQEPLQQLEAQFERDNPNIELQLEFQGSQEMVNKYLNEQNDFKATVLIPANTIILDELRDRLGVTNNAEPFYESPRPIAKTLLVGIVWPEHAKVLFPNQRWDWERVEQAIQAGSWEKIGGSSDWGSFDLVVSDPTRSHSGQVTLNLWAQSKLDKTPDSTNLNDPAVQSLFSSIKRAVYQPPRSTDILLQEFIARGPNDADAATVYESIALYRWQQSAANQGQPYQIYYLDPTIETTATAAILRRDIDAGTAKAASKFLDYLTQPEQQAIFVRYGFRPTNSAVDINSVANSPWTQNIPGAEVNPTVQRLPHPDVKAIAEIQRLWERTN
jgi:Zn-dependent protease with chaperone function/ABC-type molybdate transport system substrate-binding protein